MSFPALCRVLETVRLTRRPADRERLFRDFLSELTDPADRHLAERFARIGGGVSVGHATRTEAVCRFLSLDREAVFEPCRKATGNAAEAQRLLMTNLAPDPGGPPLRLAETEVLFASIRNASSRQEKTDALMAAFGRMGALEAADFLRMLGPGAPRFGLEPPGRNDRESAAFPSGTLTAVVLYASSGSGWRGGAFTEFTLGVDVRLDDRFPEAYIPIGKAVGGDADLTAELARLAKARVAETFGPTALLRPEIVAEAAFDGIEVNRRTKAGYALRNPRITAIRSEENLGSVDTLADIERRFIESGTTS